MCKKFGELCNMTFICQKFPLLIWRLNLKLYHIFPLQFAQTNLWSRSHVSKSVNQNPTMDPKQTLETPREKRPVRPGQKKRTGSDPGSRVIWPSGNGHMANLSIQSGSIEAKQLAELVTLAASKKPMSMRPTRLALAKPTYLTQHSSPANDLYPGLLEKLRQKRNS